MQVGRTEARIYSQEAMSLRETAPWVSQDTRVPSGWPWYLRAGVRGARVNEIVLQQL